MLKKLRFFWFIGILAIVLFFFPAQSFAQYYVHIMGNSLVAGDENNEWFTSQGSAAKGPDGTGGRYYYAPVNFRGGGYYIKQMSVIYMDTDTNAYVRVRLMRRFLPGGTSSIQTVAEFQSDTAGAPSFAKAHVAAIPGTKYIDDDYWGYYIEVYFSDSNDDGQYLFVYQIRIKYYY